LAPDPAKKNQYPPDLQTEIKLDYIYYLTNGETKKAEALKILTEKNRGTNRMRSALKSLRAIDETFIKTEEFKRVKNLEDLSSRSRHRYRSALLNKRDMVVVMQADEGNREYVEKMLRQFGSTRELSGDMNVNTVVELLINVREKILNEHPMFAVENVYNKALSELRDDHGQYAVEAATFYEAWLGEMEMAADIHRQVIEIQQRSNRPLLVVLNERTVPVYFGRNHLPENYASRFGIVQKIDDEAILDQLGKRNLSEKELRDIGDGLFAAGQIAPLHGFKIGSSHDDINDNTLGIYIKNMSKMMEIFGGDIVFVDLSRRRVGGANAYLHAYLESNRLGNVMPLGKLREYKGRRFDGARGLHGLPELSFPNRQGTWYLCDPCKINEEEFDAIASRSRREAVANEIKSNELRSYFGGQKPFADDREHAFHQMRRVTNPTGAGVAPRFLKNKEAWSIPDLREGVIPICEYLARISGRAVPELINGSFDTLKPYYRFSLELMRVLDTLFAEEGLGPKNLQKRFYGSDCFGYQIRDLTEERKSSLISRLNYIFTIRKLSIRAVDSGKFIDIIRSDVNKGRAVAHFAEMIKIPEYKIVRIGDQPLGNDREMLARGRAYNVGVEPQGGQMPGLKTMSKKGPEGVLQVLDKVEQEGFEALAVDIDGTIESSKRVIEKLRQYLREGKKIAIVTGRGGSAQRKVVSRIKEGLEATHKTNLFVYLYNGAMLSP
jgi:hypothetical protein